MNALPTILAVLGAATFAISTSVQHQVAEATPSSARGALGLVAHLLRRPAWLLGQVIGVVGLGLHAAALHYGRIAVVQPIVISGVVFAVPLRSALSRRFPSRRELRAVLLTGAGLAVFLVASRPSPGAQSVSGVLPVVLTVVGLGIAGAATLVSRVVSTATRKAFLLGVTAGVLFGLVAALLKMTLQDLARGGLLQMLSGWTFWVLLLAGALGGLANQVAYRIAPLSASMPVLNIVDGLVALGFGFFVFQETPRHSPVFVAIELAAAACMAVGLWLLARLEDAPLFPPTKIPGTRW